jgi:hypothetical protein
MAAAAPPTKRGKYSAHALDEKVWPLNLDDSNKSLKSEDLASALAVHVNEGQTADRLPRTAPSKTSVNDWRKAAINLRQQLAEVTSKGQAATIQRNKATANPSWRRRHSSRSASSKATT